MAEGAPVDLHGLLVRMTQGDPAAPAQVIAAAYERLRCLARVILNEDFPRLKAAPSLLQTTDVANEAVLGMYTMLAEIQPATPLDFFRLAAQRIRWLLLDRAKIADRTRRERLDARPADVASKSELDQSTSESLEALYQEMERLPEQERQVVDLLYFHGLPQTEAAQILDVTERLVRRYWASARLRLSHSLKDVFFSESSGGAGLTKPVRPDL